MKAAWLERYSKAEPHLTVGEQPTPSVGAKDVLLRVSVAAVNPLDNMIAHGEVKAIVPYKTPLIMGNECVGIVEKTGASATKFKPGERVYCRLPLSRIGASPVMKLAFGFVGRKNDKLAAKNGQTYDFIFVHSDGTQLAEASDILAQRAIRPSVDGVFDISEVDAALKKVAGGGSRGKTVLHIQ